MWVKLWYAVAKRGWSALEPVWLLENLISVPFSSFKKEKIKINNNNQKKLFVFS